MGVEFDVLFVFVGDGRTSDCIVLLNVELVVVRCVVGSCEGWVRVRLCYVVNC